MVTRSKDMITPKFPGRAVPRGIVIPDRLFAGHIVHNIRFTRLRSLLEDRNVMIGSRLGAEGMSRVDEGSSGGLTGEDIV